MPVIDIEPPLKEWLRPKYQNGRDGFATRHADGWVAVSISPWTWDLDDLLHEVVGKEIVVLSFSPGYHEVPRRHLDEIVRRFGPEAHRLTVRELSTPQRNKEDQ